MKSGWSPPDSSVVRSRAVFSSPEKEAGSCEPLPLHFFHLAASTEVRREGAEYSARWGSTVRCPLLISLCLCQDGSCTHDGGSLKKTREKMMGFCLDFPKQNIRMLSEPCSGLNLLDGCRECPGGGRDLGELQDFGLIESG